MHSRDETASALLYTIGHSDRRAGALIDVLRAAGIATVVDVRAQPHSTRYPQFAGDALRAALETAGFVYHWAGRQLGGFRAPRTDSPHLALVDDGLRGYADYMDSDDFKKGAVQLMRLGAKQKTAMLCAERLPEHCHRSLIADYLTLQAVRVLHLIDAGDTREHHLRPEARRESARLVYDRHTTGRLDL
jgi:uncharacterized protein (DUF488 family)